MDIKRTTVLSSAQTERTEELAGVLTAISVVSRRLARKLALLDRRPAEKGGGENERRNCVTKPPG